MNTLWRKKSFGVLIWPFSFFFRFIVSLRQLLYDLRVLRPAALPVPVISIGNITVGGTGKTPLVIHTARELQKRGRIAAVISRGYGRKSTGPLLVSDGRGKRTDPALAGDEPWLISRRLPSTPVVVAGRRKEAAETAVRSCGADWLVLDDAFQHWQLTRDIDLVVIDATNPWGNRRLLPAGPLREPLRSLRRADAVFLTRTDQALCTDEIIKEIRAYTDAPVISCAHRSSAYIDLQGQNRLPVSALQGKKVLCFAGIGNPESFRISVEESGAETAELVTFPDHYWYRISDLERLFAKARKLDISSLVTTEKDSVRLPHLPDGDIRIYYLEIDLTVLDREAYDDFFNNVVFGGR